MSGVRDVGALTLAAKENEVDGDSAEVKTDLRWHREIVACKWVKPASTAFTSRTS
jgi:hypothetical protein